MVGEKPARQIFLVSVVSELDPPGAFGARNFFYENAASDALIHRPEQVPCLLLDGSRNGDRVDKGALIAQSDGKGGEGP
jgi:hypothetical protein